MKLKLGLSLGESTTPTTTTIFTFLGKKDDDDHDDEKMVMTKDLGFCMGLGPFINNINGGIRRKNSSSSSSSKEIIRVVEEDHDDERRGSSDPMVHELDLLPLHQSHHHSSSNLPFSWLSPSQLKSGGLEVAQSQSPNSGASSMQMERHTRKRYMEESGIDDQRDHSDHDHDHDEDDDNNNNGLNRKKLRLSKQQSAFLEDTFKDHNTLNPKQKLALAKQLNLRPRQVEVWFQNRRARTKLKQTEVDCEYMKRSCETLREENRRLQKEVNELRSLKYSPKPFFMQLPPTTLTMCPSCERVVSSSTTTTAINTTSSTLYPFSHQAVS